MNAPAQRRVEQLGRGRLRQIIAYGRKVYALDGLLDGVEDGRQHPEHPPGLIARIVFMVGLLRLRSFNALEPRLAEPFMQRALGVRVQPEKVCSVDTVARALRRGDAATARSAVVKLVRKAERNKVFREGWLKSMRFVAIDGWELFSSRSRHCPACLTREITVGSKVVTEYYHRYVVALLIDEHLEVVLDFEPIRSADVRIEQGETDIAGHEGEQTAAKRLVRSLRKTYGRWLDVLVVDALYPNGPFFTVADECGFGVIAVAKKATDEPLKEAMAIWGEGPAEQVLDDKAKKERIELWDCPELTTLSSYNGPIRVVRAVVHKAAKKTAKPNTWCFAVTGKATRLSARQVSMAGRGRWHLENTGFDQWTQYWPFTHVFTHGGQAIDVLLWLFFLAFNLLQLFVYRQIGGYGRLRGKDVTRTFLRLIDEMRDDLARLDGALWDSS